VASGAGQVSASGPRQRATGGRAGGPGQGKVGAEGFRV